MLNAKTKSIWLHPSALDISIIIAAIAAIISVSVPAGVWIARIKQENSPAAREFRGKVAELKVAAAARAMLDPGAGQTAQDRDNTEIVQDLRAAFVSFATDEKSLAAYKQALGDLIAGGQQLVQSPYPQQAALAGRLSDDCEGILGK